MNLVYFRKPLYLLVLTAIFGCNPKNTTMQRIKTLTSSDKGHMLHHNGSFNATDEWIVFDTRNDETKIGETGEIGIVNVKTKEEKIIYLTTDQTVYGPGVGAVSFHPSEDRVIFIHGLLDAHKGMPYGMTRRFGMMVDLSSPLKGIPADCRDVTSPYQAGTLRGGSHSHCWSSDGNMISFTYNDQFVNPELRTVGVMVQPDQEIFVDSAAGNIQGKYYSAIIADVIAEPENGSDQISKAFDECWLGNISDDPNPSIVFQGTTKNKDGEDVVEIFLVDIDPQKILQDKEAIGNDGEKIRVPKGIVSKRLSHSENGLSDLRHWLRSSPDGKFVYALAKDKNGFNQIARCEVQTGELKNISNLDFSISSPINIDPKGEKITFIANNNVYLFDLKSLKADKTTDFGSDDLPLLGVPVFSRDGSKLAFNQFVEKDGRKNVQIKMIY